MAGEAEQFRFIGSRAGAQPHEGDRHVALVFPPHADQLGDLDRGVRLQLFLYLLGVDQVAAQAQRVVQPGQVDECPVRLHLPEVTGAEPAVGGHRRRGGRGVAEVAGQHVIAAELQLTRLARRPGRAGTGCDATDLHVRGDQIPAAAGPGGGGCLRGPGAHQREALR